MALDINGYNTTFKAFADFAQKRVDANDETAIADAEFQRPLVGRRVLSITQSLTDDVHKWTRGMDEWTVNDRTRDIFKKAIIDMFGGESKIPASVKKAMLLSDYNSGKPLTARRIMAVKAAIDADGTAAARSAKIRLETFSPEVEKAALELGYLKKELPKLARAAHFYAQATGKSEMEAMREVAKPGTDANRLMDYGGRFMQNAENFSDGLRLVKLFSQWHDGLSAVKDSILGYPPTYAGVDTPSKVNMHIRASEPAAKLGLERFIFEDIATNPDFNLKETDAERAFGVEHNKVSRFMTVAENTSTVGTLANIPPEKRRVVFAAFNAFSTLAATGPERSNRKSVHLESFFLARVIRNLPKLEAVFARTGTLTGRDVIKNAFPDIRHPGNYDADTIAAWEDALSDGVMRQGGQMSVVSTMLENSGATIREAEDAVRRGKELPRLPYISGAQYSIKEVSSIADAGITTMNGDICRLSLYKTGTGDNEKPVFAEESHAWKFAFPDGERLETSGTKHGDIPKVGQKIRQLCGEVHQRQIGAVALLLSQAGMGALQGRAIAKYGIATNEHSPVNFTLSRNEETGAVTIKYSSPAELPFRFEWTATVDVDGKVSSTPLKFEKPVEMNVGLATKYVEDAARDLGVNLTSDQKNLASALVARYGTDMYEKNARLFAKFVVHLRLTDASAKGDRQRAADTAKSIRKWHSFEFGDHRLNAFTDAAKEQVQSTLREYLSPDKADWFTNNIHNTFTADADRSIFILNGKVYDKRPANELVDAFKALVPDPKAQKILTTYMNQLCFETFMPLANHVPLNTGVDAIKLPGAGAIANRDMAQDFYMAPVLSFGGHSTTHDLRLSEDGKTATITQTIFADLAAPHADVKLHFGSATFTQRIVIDLSQEEPVVTDYKLSQTIE